VLQLFSTRNTKWWELWELNGKYAEKQNNCIKNTNLFLVNNVTYMYSCPVQYFYTRQKLIL